MDAAPDAAAAGELSVYERVLGPRAQLLAPELRQYFGSPGAGLHGHGEGVFEFAGPRLRLYSPVFALLAPARILFPERARDVPFTVENRRHGDVLRAVRTFRLPRGDRVMVDELRVVDGALHDFLGTRGQLEVALALRVHRGRLHMTSTAAWLRLGGLRVRLPALLSARVVLREEWEHDHQRVSVSLRHPLLGEVFGYRGTFRYGYRAE